MVTVDDLAAFIAARYDEAEKLAREAEEFDGKVGHRYRAAPNGEFLGAITLSMFHSLNRPARRLADIKLKRAILAEHGPVPFWGNNGPPHRERTPENAVRRYCGCQARDGVIEDAYPCATVRQLGTEFASHPGYRSEWRPE